MADFASLVEEVARTKGIEASAVVAFQGATARLEKAVADAVAANDQADLSAIQNAVADLRASSDALAAAIPANSEPTAGGETGTEG